MPSLAQHLFAQAANSAWANHRLLAACARLSQEELVAARVSFFPSIKSTLNHNLTVDWYYVDAIERSLAGLPPDLETGRRFFDPEEPFDTCAELSREQHAVDQRLLAVCRGLRDAQLASQVGVPRSHGVAPERLDRLLGHLFQHQTHHRGQVHAMLSGTHVAPPQLDEFFCAGDAALREAEMRELGLREAEIWG